MQENAGATWEALAAPAPLELDVLLWTRTWSLPDLEQSEALSALELAGVPTVGYHLDRWWGLEREHQLIDEPFFGCDVIVTAEGGVPAEAWATVGVDHVWAQPAVLREQCIIGTAQQRWRAPVGFVGSHAGYHDEWPWRRELVRWLRRYDRRARIIPGHPAKAVRGQELAEVYASIDVIVGDSCLAPYPWGPCERYWSDRVPETLGRGGFLLHPWVAGMEELGGYIDGEHLIYYEAGDVLSLEHALRWWTNDARAADRQRIALAGRQLVIERHTYEQRMLELFEDLHERGLIDEELVPRVVAG